MDGGRQSGKTTKMILALPTGRKVIIVVHTPAMRQHTRDLVRRLRPDIHPNMLDVHLIQSRADVERFKGLSKRVHVAIDHAVREQADRPVLVALAEVFEYRNEHS